MMSITHAAAALRSRVLCCFSMGDFQALWVESNQPIGVRP